MKRIKMFGVMKDFEEFVNRTDIDIIQVDVKVVDQSFYFQESFVGIVFYNESIGENNDSN